MKSIAIFLVLVSALFEYNNAAKLPLSASLQHPSTGDDIQRTHPPVFGKHVYFAKYTENNELEMEEQMAIVFGAKGKITIIQSDYREYFEVSQDSSAEEKINVQKVKDLPKKLTEKRFLVIDIKAKSENADIPGRASLIIYFPNSHC